MMRFALFPLAVLYDAVTSMRNRMYDLALKPSATFETPVISVGNLTVGGTGKTPMIEHMIRMLSNRYRLATLSRGYKRITKGFRIAGPADTAATIGDEPFQFFRKFGQQVMVTVGEERAMAIPLIVDHAPDVQVVLLDDAFQHRRVKPHFQILLTDYNRPFYNDMLLPAGRLRESKKGAERADMVVVTKCPSSISEEEMIEIGKHVAVYTNKPVFFSHIRYGAPVGNASEMKPKVMLVTGLADPGPMEAYVQQTFQVVATKRFPDHHRYTDTELKGIMVEADRLGATILTSEKDWVKISELPAVKKSSTVSLFYLPIEVDFIKNGKEFDEMVQTAITDASK